MSAKPMMPPSHNLKSLLACAVAGYLGLWPAAYASGGSTLIAQASTNLEERVRATAGRMATYRAMLADTDPNVRMAAIDEMSRSPDAAVREMAFDAGFASAEPAVRALALRGRLVVAKTLTVELLNSRNLPAQEWSGAIRPFGTDKIVFTQVAVNPNTGEVTANNGAGRLAGLELHMSRGGGFVTRLRLGDGNAVVGTCTIGQAVVPCRLAIQ